MTYSVTSFLEGKEKNAWCEFGKLRIYMRKTVRYNLQTLDIATITIHNPKFRGKGAFTEFLAWIEEEVVRRDIDQIFIENVLDERFQNFFLKKGYSRDKNYIDPPCFHKKFSKKPLSETSQNKDTISLDRYPAAR